MLWRKSFPRRLLRPPEALVLFPCVPESTCFSASATQQAKQEYQKLIEDVKQKAKPEYHHLSEMLESLIILTLKIV